MALQSSEDLGPHRVELAHWICEAPFEQHLGMRILEAADGAATLTMPFQYHHAQGAGVMHGGALTALADTAVAMAIKSLLPEGTHFGTIGLETRFLRAVRQGQVRAEARVLSRNDRDLLGHATVYDEDNQPVIEFESRFRIARHQPNVTSTRR